MSILNYFQKKSNTNTNNKSRKRKLEETIEGDEEEFNDGLNEPPKKKLRIKENTDTNENENEKQKNKTNTNTNSKNESKESENECNKENIKPKNKTNKIEIKNKNKNETEIEEKELSQTETKTNKNDKNSNNKKNEIQTQIPIADLRYDNAYINLEKGWKEMLKNEFKKSYFKELLRNLKRDEDKGKEIFPPVNQVFRAFDLCVWDNLKVVILGQDPYHDNGQAEGLCFSVPKGIKLPSSLRNIFKECGNDISEFKKPNHGSLIEWAKQGVLLLNTVFTVEAHKANSHKKYGWQQFTDSVIQIISKKHDGCVFIFWGKQAQKKEIMINKSKHKIIKSAHPSGLSASRGFYGSKPFSKTNQYLIQMDKKPIDWNIPDL